MNKAKEIITIAGACATMSYGAMDQAQIARIDSVYNGTKAIWPQTIKTDSLNRRYLYTGDTPINIDSAIVIEHQAGDKQAYEGTVASFGGDMTAKAGACTQNGYLHKDIKPLILENKLNAKEITDSLARMSTNGIIATEKTQANAQYAFDVNVAPNPFTNYSSINAILPRASELEIKVFEPSGRLVGEIYKGHRPEGVNTFKWNNNLPKGNYICNIKTNHGSRSKLVTKVR